MTLNELLRDRGRLFWTLNVTGWSGYVLTAYFGALAHEKPDSYIAVIVATALVGFFAGRLTEADINCRIAAISGLVRVDVQRELLKHR